MGSPDVLHVGHASDLEQVRGEWLDLAERVSSSSYFQTPDWVVGWWETIGRKPPTQLATWEGGSGRLDAVVALSRVRERLHRSVPITVPVYVNTGSGPGDPDHCGWPVSPGLEDDVSAWLSDQFRDSTVLLRNLDPASWEGIVPPRGRMLDSFRCPRLVLPPAGTPVGRSANFRRQLKAYARRLEHSGVTFQWLPPGQFDGGSLESLFLLHERRRSRTTSATSFQRDQMRFHRGLIERGDGRRGPAGLVAYQKGRPIGVLYGFWWKTTFYAYQSGWDPAWASHSLGTVMLHQAIESARSFGAQTFDFLRGAEPYKYRFGAVDRVDQTWIVPRGFSGRLLRFGYMARELRRTIRSGTQRDRRDDAPRPPD